MAIIVTERKDDKEIIAEALIKQRATLQEELDAASKAAQESFEALEEAEKKAWDAAQAHTANVRRVQNLETRIDVIVEVAAAEGVTIDLE